MVLRTTLVSGQESQESTGRCRDAEDCAWHCFHEGSPLNPAPSCGGHECPRADRRYLPICHPFVTRPLEVDWCRNRSLGPIPSSTTSSGGWSRPTSPSESISSVLSPEATETPTATTIC